MTAPDPVLIDGVSYGGATIEEQMALIAAGRAAYTRAEQRRGYVANRRALAESAIGVFNDWLDQFPGFEIPTNGPMPTGPDTLATLKSQTLWLLGRSDARDAYLREHEVRLTQTVIPLLEFVFVLAQALLEEIERSETFVPPIGFLVE